MKPFNAAQTYLINRPRAGILINRAAGMLAFAVFVAALTEVLTPAPSQGVTVPVLDYTAVSQMLVQTAQFAAAPRHDGPADRTVESRSSIRHRTLRHGVFGRTGEWLGFKFVAGHRHYGEHRH